jgi:hypothetical protein
MVIPHSDVVETLKYREIGVQITHFLIQSFKNEV